MSITTRALTLRSSLTSPLLTMRNLSDALRTSKPPQSSTSMFIISALLALCAGLVAAIYKLPTSLFLILVVVAVANSIAVPVLTRRRGNSEFTITQRGLYQFSWCNTGLLLFIIFANFMVLLHFTSPPTSGLPYPPIPSRHESPLEKLSGISLMLYAAYSQLLRKFQSAVEPSPLPEPMSPHPEPLSEEFVTGLLAPHLFEYMGSMSLEVFLRGMWGNSAGLFLPEVSFHALRVRHLAGSLQAILGRMWWDNLHKDPWNSNGDHYIVFGLILLMAIVWQFDTFRLISLMKSLETRRGSGYNPSDSLKSLLDRDFSNFGSNE